MTIFEKYAEKLADGVIEVSDLPKEFWNNENAMYIAHTYPGQVFDIPDDYKNPEIYATSIAAMAEFEDQQSLTSFTVKVIEDAMHNAAKIQHMDDDAESLLVTASR